MPHIHELVDFTVEVFIVHKNKVLLRKHDKLGIWLSVGGHIELDEDPNQAAVREVKEEVGLDITLSDALRKRDEQTETFHELIPPYFLNRHTITDKHQHVTLVYFAKSDQDEITEMVEREKSKECKWFTQEELEENPEIRPNVKFYAKKALEILSS